MNKRPSPLDTLRDLLSSASPAETGLGRWGVRSAERTRSELETAGQYSRFVRFMKVALPLGAVILVLSTIIYSALTQTTVGVSFFLSSENDIGNDLRMANPKFLGYDSKQRPVEVFADAANQDPDNPDLIHLENIRGKLMADDPATSDPDDAVEVFLTADRGTLHSKNREILLQGNVLLLSSSNYRFRTEQALIDLDRDMIRGDSPIHGEGAVGSINADRFTVLNNGSRVVFSGNVRTRIIPE